MSRDPSCAHSVYRKRKWHTPNQEAAWLVWLHAELDNPTDLAVLTAIASFLNDDGKAWPSVEALEELAHRGHTAISDSLARLKASGVLTIEDRTTKGQSNLYTIPLLAEHMDKRTQSGKRIGRTDRK